MFRRPAIKPREPSSDSRIRFLHPGYPAPYHTLFSLPRVDPSPEHAGDLVGVHHRTALLAGQIIAGNAFSSSFLSLDRQGAQRVDELVSLDGVLVLSEYYLIVAGYDESNPYPIVPSWEYWQFPYDTFPAGHHNDIWPNPSATAAIPSCCAVTASSLGPTKAHLIPKLEDKWLRRNGIAWITNIDDPGNLLILRSDLHKEFDSRQWTIVPKPGPSISPGQEAITYEYAVHVIGSAPCSSELRDLYHNVTLQNCRYIPWEAVLAHFAWSILYLVKPFLLCLVSRKVRILVLDEGNEDTPARYDVVYLKPDKLDHRYGGGGSRSASPRKRSRAPQQQSVDDGLVSKKRRRDDDDDDEEDDSSAYGTDAGGSFDTLSSSCGDGPGPHDDSAITWHWLDHVDDNEYEQAVEAGLAERRGRSRTRKPCKRACLWGEVQEINNGPSEQAGDDHRDRPLLTTSFSTVSTPGQDSIESSDPPAILPVLDVATGPNKSAAAPEHHNPLITSPESSNQPSKIA